MGFVFGKLLAIAVWLYGKLQLAFGLYIDYCDFALVTFVSWLGFRYGANLHSGLSLLIGLAIATVLILVFKTRIGFWIITPIFSFIWTWTFMEFILKGLLNLNLDSIWYWIIAVPVFGYNIYKHMFAVARKYVREDIEAEKRAMQFSE